MSTATTTSTIWVICSFQDEDMLLTFREGKYALEAEKYNHQAVSTVVGTKVSVNLVIVHGEWSRGFPSLPA